MRNIEKHTMNERLPRAAIKGNTLDILKKKMSNPKHKYEVNVEVLK